jgi:hypothetical protein
MNSYNNEQLVYLVQITRQQDGESFTSSDTPPNGSHPTYVPGGFAPDPTVGFQYAIVDPDLMSHLTFVAWLEMTSTGVPGRESKKRAVNSKAKSSSKSVSSTFQALINALTKSTMAQHYDSPSSSHTGSSSSASPPSTASSKCGAN